MRPEGGLEQFAPTQKKEPFNTQMADQLKGLQPENFGVDFDMQATVDERENVAVINSIETEESLSITLNDQERLHELKDIMQQQVAQVEALRSQAAAAGYKNISYHGLTGAACFDELLQKQSELESALFEIGKHLAENENNEVSDVEYEEIQLHIDIMQDLGNTLTEAVAALSVSEALESAPETTETVTDELQVFIDETRQFYQVASSWFPRTERNGEVYEYLNGLLADAERAQSLVVDAESFDSTVLREQLDELTESAAAYELHLRELHEQEQYRQGDELASAEVVPENQSDTTSEPFVLTPEQRVDVVESSEDMTELYRHAVEQMQQVDTYPYYDPTERTTVKTVFNQLRAAVEADEAPQVVNQKYHNLQSIIEMLAEPDADVMKRRADNMIADLEYLPFGDPESVATARAMYENFARQHADVAVSDEVLRKSFDSLADYINDSADVAGSLFGVTLPEAGAEGVASVRTLRRTLIGISDARSGVELSRGQRAALEAIITILQYAAHDELTAEQAAEVQSLAKQVRAGELIIPFTLEQELQQSERDTETKEDGDEEEEVPAAKTGRINIETEAEETDSTVSIIVKSKETEPVEDWDSSESVEPHIQDEVFDYWEESLEEAAESQSQPAPVVSNPVGENLSADEESALASVEERDPVNWVKRPTVQSWEERRERRDGLSVAKRIIQGQLLEHLKAKGITPRDIEREVNAEIQRFDSKNAPSWFERLSVPNPVYKTFKDKTLAELESIREEFPAGYASEFEDQYQASHSVFYGNLSDFIENELIQVVPDHSPEMTLEELTTLYIATRETQ